MSIDAINRVWALDIEPTEKLLLLAIADFTNNEGNAWPSIPTIARKTSLSEDTVRRKIRKLSVDGILSSTPRKDKHGRDTSYMFQLFPTPVTTEENQANLENISPEFAIFEGSTVQGLHAARVAGSQPQEIIPEAPQESPHLPENTINNPELSVFLEGSTVQGLHVARVAGSEGGGLHGATLITLNHHIEPKNILSKCFELLWQDYPKKHGKHLAQQRFNATVKTKADCQRIRKALDNYLAELNREEWRHPQNGSTWFNAWQEWEEDQNHAATPTPKPSRPLQVAL